MDYRHYQNKNKPQPEEQLIVLLKKTAIALIVALFRLILLAKKILIFLHNEILVKFIRWFFKIFLRLGFIQIYKIYLSLKIKINKIYLPAKNKFLYSFVHQQTINLTIIFLIGGVVISNFKMRQVQADTFGTKTLLATLAPRDDLGEQGELIVETNIQKSQPSSYQGAEQYSLKAPRTSSLPQEETEEINIFKDGSALIKPSIISTKPNLKLRDRIETYVVQEGDVIGSVAEKFGISVQTILWENNITARSIIRPGDKITILPVSGITYKIKKQDTLDKIAKSYNISKDDILNVNRLASEKLAVNDKIILPGAKPLYQYVAPVTPTQSSFLGSLIKPTPSAVTAGAGYLWPTSIRRITQYFTWRHFGLDIGGPIGTPIYAANDGIVEIAQASGWNGGYGRTIVINHQNGAKTRYGHMTRLYVSKGQNVRKGDVIGLMGSTGRSTGPHLHFEITINGRRLNPLSYIKR